MPEALVRHWRDTHLGLLKLGDLKLSEPLSRGVTLSGDVDFSRWLREERSKVSHAIIILPEDEFVPSVHILREKLSEPGEKDFQAGFIIVSDDPSAVLKSRSGFPELIDVWSKEELEKAGEREVLRAVRQLLRGPDISRPKVDNETLLKLNEIFIALSAERNPKKLLATILLQGISLTTAEGGVLYMIEEKDGEMILRTRIRKGVSSEVRVDELSERVSESSFSGYAALTGKPINIPKLGNVRPYSQPCYDPKVDYSLSDVKSMLTVPLKNRRNEIIAVLQLVNKHDEEEGPEMPPVPFERQDMGLLSSFGSQAAICLENVELYGDIQRLFDGFVKASITAIESRDPSTGGHSERVAKMSVALAQATTECSTGIYRSVRFRDEEIIELNYAALLHDFGKIGVREEVLVKAKKLYPYQLEAIRERIQICKAAARIDLLEKQVKASTQASESLKKDYEQRLRQLDLYWDMIVSANEPSVLESKILNTLEQLKDETLSLPDGNQISVITEDEFSALSVLRGTLTDSERLEVESHVRHTYQFLKMIPWTKDFRHLTDIAYAHHEKLDGTGYPRNLTAHEIPLQSKIMAIVDIFDALTAADRWYKDAVPMEKAIEILSSEVSQGKLDPVLFELFVEKRIFQLSQLLRQAG